MEQIAKPLKPSTDQWLLERTRLLFTAQEEANCRRTDRLFAGLILVQWLACIITALTFSPRAWEGTYSSTHIHVWAAWIIGGIITIFPLSLSIFYPGKAVTRHAIAAGQMLITALLIHLSGGRIETHFQIFGVLAFLAFYHDWRVLVTASLIVAVDHAVRGIFWPQSVYGISKIDPWRWVEHTGWVLFIDVILVISIRSSLKSLWDRACRQAELERINEVIEGKIAERTKELQIEIAERKEAENELAATNARLEMLSRDLERSRDDAIKASQYKSEFLANMSHEIRTPLNAVVGMSDLLARTSLSDDQKELALVINSSADILLATVNDILDYSKIESGKLDLEIIDFDLVEMIEGCAALVAEKARSKQLSLSTFVEPSLPKMMQGDPSRIRQVLLNFLSNSIKFTDHGEIILRAVRQELHEETGAVAVRFSVSDTGIGLSEVAQQRLFQPFTQADASITRKYGGTGLGLTICKRLVEAMSGKIDYQTDYGKGTTFSFEITLMISPEQPVSELSVPANLQEARILLVDGPQGAQQLLNAYIASWGLRSSCATDQSKALLMMRREAAANDSYDLVFLSLLPGDKAPIDFLNDVKNTPQLAGTRLVIVDSGSDRHLGEELLSKGFAAYLPMPIRQSRLFDCIITLLEPDQTAQAARSEVHHKESKNAPALPEPGNLILVVEDNSTNQKVALLQLRELGLAAHAVGNGIEALEAVARTQYTLILMDCQMPEMDGLQTTREIRKMEARTGRHSTIVAMTAHAMTSDRLECLAAGMDDYISKPVTQRKLKEVLERWLPVGVTMTKTQPEPTTHDSQRKPLELELLRSTFGDEITTEYLREFLIYGRNMVEDLKKAIQDQDAGKVKFLIHDLKGSSATIYATEIAELSRALESSVKSEGFSWENVEVHMHTIELAWSRAESFINQCELLKT